MKNVHEVEVKLEKEWVDALDKAYKKNNKDTKIDGFRKGKAPKEVYIKQFGIESLYSDAVNSVIDDAYKKIIDENNFDVAVQPTVDIVGVSDTNVILKFTIITKPEVTLGEYKNLKVKKDKVSVTEKEVTEEIEHLREHMADIIVKENGTIVDGDTAIIDFEGFVDGKPLEGGKGENFPLEIGSNSFIPGFEEGLIGLKVGEEKELNLTFPENYVEDLKGKDVTFKVKVNEVKMRSLPDINEDFFQDLGYDDIKTEEDLRKKIKAELKESKEHEANDLFLDACLEKASENITVEINPEIIDEEVHRMIDQYANQLERQGMNIDTYYQITGTTHEQLHDMMTPEAEKRVRSRYLLEGIADAEKIDFSDKEVEERAKEMADNYGITVEELIEAFGHIDVVKYDMRMHEALDILRKSNEETSAKKSSKKEESK